jgi:hypothetical protein
MYGFKFEALAAMNGHQSNGGQMQRTVWDLPQITFFREQNQLAHPIKDSLDRGAGACRAIFTYEI